MAVNAVRHRMLLQTLR